MVVGVEKHRGHKPRFSFLAPLPAGEATSTVDNFRHAVKMNRPSRQKTWLSHPIMTAPMRTLNRLSFIFPVYNEIETLPHLRAAVDDWMNAHQQMDFELVMVNDGSQDGSIDYLRQWAAVDERVRVVSFSRNFGHQAAVTAGLEHARGDAVVIMDADLQDPLTAVDLMMAKYGEGFEVVYGERLSREGETAFKKFTAWAFYRLLKKFFLKDIPLDTGDFRLISRDCVQAINALPEKSRFVRGLFSWVGFRQTSVRYERDARKYGETKYPLRKMLAFAWTGITSFSILPIRMVTVLGFVAAIGSMAYLLYAVYQHFTGHTVAGWTTIVILQTFMGGSILFAIGIVGEYIGKIYEEVKARPVYIKEFEIDKKVEKRPARDS
jgi:dolichol-phosphate mannosyltransferase